MAKSLCPWIFDPSDFLVGGQIPAYGICPSLNGGRSTAATIDKNSAILPDNFVNLPKIPGPMPSLSEE
ncbi:MAG: hypothetical protein ACKVKH_07655 [Verrucomicrobiales bacterium]|jgi:hypothetical protein|nr:hypothetical protein [bacterium]